MELKLIALDLDGTTLRTDKSLSQYTRKILFRCAERGIRIAVASGRAFSSLPEELLQLPGVDYAITSNGAAVYRAKSGERIHHFPMEKGKSEELLQLIREEQSVFEVFLDGIPYGSAEYVRDPGKYGVTEYGIPYIQRTRTPVENLQAFAWEHRDMLDCVDLIAGNPEEKQRLVDKLDRMGGFYVTSSVPHLIEIANAGAGKGAALQTLCRDLGLQPENCIAFGNAENDLDMMAFAGIGAAVANSPEHVRRAADVVVRSNDEDGVAGYLEGLL